MNLQRYLIDVPLSNARSTPLASFPRYSAWLLRDVVKVNPSSPPRTYEDDQNAALRHRSRIGYLSDPRVKQSCG
jgi:hypothetical protein